MASATRLTVLNLAADNSYDVAVLEMGMSTPMNEIQRLCRITPPDVAVELNVLPVHVEHLGSIENVAKAKAELVEGMKKAESLCLTPMTLASRNARAEPRDDNHVRHRFAGRRQGVGNRVSRTSVIRRFVLTTPDGASPVEFPLNGRHNILNALAAAAVGHAFAMSAGEIATSLSTVTPPPQRGEILRFKKGFTVINDSYNSNPAALISMVQTLVDGAAGAKRRIVVAGEMLELGANEPHDPPPNRRDDRGDGHRYADRRPRSRKELVRGAESAGTSRRLRSPTIRIGAAKCSSPRSEKAMWYW